MPLFWDIHFSDVILGLSPTGLIPISSVSAEGITPADFYLSGYFSSAIRSAAERDET